MFEQVEWESNKIADELSKKLFAKRKMKRKPEEPVLSREAKIAKLDSAIPLKKSKKRKQREQSFGESTDEFQVKRKHQRTSPVTISTSSRKKSKIINDDLSKTSKIINEDLSKKSKTFNKDLSQRSTPKKSKEHKKAKLMTLQPAGAAKPKSPRNKYKHLSVKAGNSNVNKMKVSPERSNSSAKKTLKVKGRSLESKDDQSTTKNEDLKMKQKKKRKLRDPRKPLSDDGITSQPAVRETKRKKKRKKKNNPKKNKYRHLVLAKSLVCEEESKSSNPEGGSKPLEKEERTPNNKVNAFNVKKLKEALNSSFDKLKELHKTFTPVTAPKKSTNCDHIHVDPEKESAVSRNTPTLRQKVTAKLNAARFRYLNEQLYTKTGEESYDLFKEDEEAFHVYHDGFQSQVKKWPSNPLDSIIKYIRNRSPTLVIADFGCGDARLAQSIPNTVHSFDLVALNDFVTACDMAEVPLADESVDMCVFCLSLMGTNLVDYLKEANRVLKMGGILKIAEVNSRFEDLSSFTACLRKLGFQKTNQNTSNKMFVTMDFKKVSDPKSTPLTLSLKPCVYKKR